MKSRRCVMELCQGLCDWQDCLEEREAEVLDEARPKSRACCWLMPRQRARPLMRRERA